MFFSAFVLLLCLSLSKAGEPCPTGDANALKTCTCSQKDTLNEAPLGALSADYKYTILICNNIANSAVLEEDLSKFNRKVIDKLIIKSVAPAVGRKLARLPSLSLKNMRIRTIEILDSQLFGDFLVQGNPLEELALSLVSLTVRNSSLHGALTYDTLGTVNTKNLEKLIKVVSVNFSDNFLTVISATAFFKSSTNLATIDLSKNEIYLVQPGAFGPVSNLRSINLANNFIESIDRSIFATSARVLETIDLGSNSLTTLPDTFFNMMPALKKVVVANNFLHSLSEKTWNSILLKLTTLDVTGNVIECGCGLVWLTKTNRTGTTIGGKCVADQFPFGVSFEHDLQSLTREQVIC